MAAIGDKCKACFRALYYVTGCIVIAIPCGDGQYLCVTSIGPEMAAHPEWFLKSSRKSSGILNCHWRP